METGKICRFLIVIFLVLTVFFFYMYTTELKNKTVLSDEFVNDAISHLNSSGIDVSAEIIDKTLPNQDIYVLEISDVNEHNTAIVNSIIDNIYSENVITAVFEVPGGTSVSVYSDEDGEKELGSIFFSKTDMNFMFSISSVTVSGADVPLFVGNVGDISDIQKNTASSILDKLVSNSSVSYRFSGNSGNQDEMLILSAVQTIDGYDINNIFLNFVFEKDELIAISGNWFYGDVAPDYHEKLVDGVNVLYKLDLANVSKIYSENVVYTMRKVDNKYFLIPGWLINYSDKDGNFKSSYFDAL